MSRRRLFWIRRSCWTPAPPAVASRGLVYPLPMLPLMASDGNTASIVGWTWHPLQPQGKAAHWFSQLPCYFHIDFSKTDPFCNDITKPSWLDYVCHEMGVDVLRANNVEFIERYRWLMLESAKITLKLWSTGITLVKKHARNYQNHMYKQSTWTSMAVRTAHLTRFQVTKFHRELKNPAFISLNLSNCCTEATIQCG